MSYGSYFLGRMVMCIRQRGPCYVVREFYPKLFQGGETLVPILGTCHTMPS